MHEQILAADSKLLRADVVDIMAELGISIDYAEGKVYQYSTLGGRYPGEKVPCECDIARAAGSVAWDAIDGKNSRLHANAAALKRGA